jgi:hypothetical protein
MAEIIVPDYSEFIVINLDFDEPAQVNRSAWTGHIQQVGLPGGSFWYGELAVTDLATEAEDRPWRAFIASLRGVQNWFKVYFPCQVHIGPAPLVAAGATSGRTVPLKGMQPSTCILEAGQHLTIPLPNGHARAVRLTAPLITDAAGNATAEFAPALNQIPALNTLVESASPYVRMASTQRRIPFPTVDGVSGFSLQLEEYTND